MLEKLDETLDDWEGSVFILIRDCNYCGLKSTVEAKLQSLKQTFPVLSTVFSGSKLSSKVQFIAMPDLSNCDELTASEIKFVNIKR